MRSNLVDKNRPIIELAEYVANRSTCHIRVGAILSDKYGVFAWGHNHSGTGLGMCAERHAISRANKKRLTGSTLTIYSVRNRNGKRLPSFPCDKCWQWVVNFKIGKVVYQTIHEGWKEITL